MLDTFKTISLSHKTAPLQVRELIALNEDEAKRLMLRLRDFFGLTDLLVISTCNRTEVYYAFDQDLNADIARLLLIEKGLTDTDNYLPYFQFFSSHDEAVRHLFEVCVGLHSQVVGDMQIPNQVKQSYQWSADLDMAGPFLHRLMHTIFFTNKRVAQETPFRDGAASVSYAAVELIDELIGENQNPNILVIGLGEIGTDVCKNLEARSGGTRNQTNITLCNRTQAKAEALASQYGFRVADFADLTDEIRRAHVIISSVQRDEPLITPALLQDMNVLTFKYFIDLSVPRSVDAAVEQIPGMLVYNIDHIRNRADEALNQRLAAIPKVEAIITQAVAEFGDWSKEMVVSPTINKLKNALEQIRRDEIARHLKHLTPDESEKVDKITKGIMQKIIKLPVLQLKAACKRGEAETLIDVLNDLFDLEKHSVEDPKHLY
ncbi:glutamyl-tRNA reductase [Spirosoma linguale]|uniref:Glutamyl-tRNA reductase n=1 Tax=Spirosoma linguale (strain ATCC 33905 / DSM 74 / LMG 10896 / Claus 1) TaxID=504472 RepID=D2QR72_SPILD|nr:glutamyl-tRNA reductase [Spirosoma linguale DSM 74]